MLREIRSRYLGTTILGAQITLTGSAGSADIGQDFTSVSRSSAGTYGANLRKAFSRLPIQVGTPGANVAAGGYYKARATQTTKTVLTGRCVDAANSADDGTQDIICCGWTSAQTGPGKIQRVNATLRHSRMFGARVTGATATVNIGTRDITVSRTSQGVYVITFTRAFAQTPIVVFTPIGTSVRAPNITSKTAASVNVTFSDNSAVAQDANFYMIVYGTDCRDPHGGARAPLENSQRIPLLMAGRITYTTGTPAVSINSEDIASVTDTGTGDVALTFATFPEGYIFKREPIVCCSNADYRSNVKANASATGVSLYITDESGTVQDPGTIDYLILGSGDATEY